MAIVDDYLSLSKAFPQSLSKREREIVNVGQLAFELEMSGLGAKKLAKKTAAKTPRKVAKKPRS
jgi:hypothetical protein